MGHVSVLLHPSLRARNSKADALVNEAFQQAGSKVVHVTTEAHFLSSACI